MGHLEEPHEPGEGGSAAAPSDRSLLLRVRGGSQDAATQLYLRYANRIRGLTRSRLPADMARLVDVEDIVQSVFGSFFRGASQGYYEVPASEELWKLFLVIALNKIRAKGAYHRAAKRDIRLMAGSEGLDDYAGAASGSDEVALAVLQMTIEETLNSLTPHHKEILALRIEGHEVADIAQRTGRSKRTVERILQECRKYLAELLDAEDQGGPRAEVG